MKFEGGNGEMTQSAVMDVAPLSFLLELSDLFHSPTPSISESRHNSLRTVL